MSGASGNISSSQLGAPAGGYDPFGGAKASNGDDTGSPLGGKTKMVYEGQPGPTAYTRSGTVPGGGSWGFDPNASFFNNGSGRPGDYSDNPMNSMFGNPMGEINASWGGMAPWDERGGFGRGPGGGGGSHVGWASPEWQLY